MLWTPQRATAAFPLLSILLVVVACNRPPPRKPGDEYLAAIEFEGNKEFSDSELRTGLASRRTEKAGRAPDLYQVQVDSDRVKGQYLREGFFEADVQSRIDRKQDAATVVYSIQEGKRSVTRVTIAGLPADPAITPAMVREQLPIEDGEPFDYETYDLAKIGMLAVVQNAGYAHAKLDARVVGDIANHTALVELVFTPGPKCRFGTVTVQGVEGPLRDSIMRRLEVREGKLYSQHAITATQRAIYGMGRFSTVQVEPDGDQDDVVNVKVAVVESARHEVALGGGIGIDPINYEVRGRAGYEVLGWPFPLDTFTLDLRPAYAYLRDGGGYEPRVRALARLSRADLWLTNATGSIEGGYRYLAYEAYTHYGPQAQVGYEARFGRALQVRAGYMIHRYDFRTPSPLVDDALQMQLGIDDTELVGAYTQSLIADLRDHPIEPTLGVYGELKLTEGTKYAGGEFNYVQVVPELRGYVPLGPVVLGARARYGAFYGDVPATERFFAGGSTSQRGFAERRLSPSVTGMVEDSTMTVPYGGAGLIDSSVEARFPITTIKKMPLNGVVFLDGADVTEKPSDLDVMNLNWAAGAGLRLLTVVGPVRADLGYRLNRKGATDPQPGSSYAFHISLGEAF
ncbi:MAG: outer membrane protein assembly factor [Kofleriaceae bacterium]